MGGWFHSRVYDSARAYLNTVLHSSLLSSYIRRTQERQSMSRIYLLNALWYYGLGMMLVGMITSSVVGYGVGTVVVTVVLCTNILLKEIRETREGKEGVSSTTNL